jgi:quercetin dioxygenase-like cupin family protein
VIVDLAALEAVRCPCGWAKRAFADVPDAPASVHLVQIEPEARTHYHRLHTEIYYVLEAPADAALELDGVLTPVAAGQAILLRPGVRHRATTPMRILNIVIPPFDPEDEWFD